ncbi:hypothetical protein AB0O67_06385 [Streptomyces sp. NPDC086077]|uniref:hypothetical protein n=1 Tax=Streptomyces sp. NPDC086077 TaxID=3154862 RepID=UPI0034177ACB
MRSSGVPLGVNLFVPSPLPGGRAEFRRYSRTIAPEGQAHDVDLVTAGPVEDDDHFTMSSPAGRTPSTVGYGPGRGLWRPVGERRSFGVWRAADEANSRGAGTAA